MGMTTEARQEAIDKAMQAYQEPGTSQEAILLPYKDGKDGPFPVITVPVKAVLFNPRSHRIKAQLESHAKRQMVTDNPYSDEAQAVIHEILTDTEGFEDLKRNLSEYGQREPGVITRGGLLVNANTRLAALRDLGEDYIRGALLPQDADEHAIDRLELELQVQRSFKQEYTPTNELIFINELLNNHSYSEEKAAKALNWAASSDDKELKRGVARVRQAIRLYALVRHIQWLSNGAIPLTFFDEKRQALIELDEKYESLKGSDPNGAELVKNARIAGILAGSTFHDLRQIDRDASIDKVLIQIEDQEILGDEVEALTMPPTIEANNNDDADLLTGGEQAEVEDIDIGPIVTLIAESHGHDNIELPSGKKTDRDNVIREFAKAIEQAADDIRADKRTTKDLNNPIKQLEDAIKKARAALDSYQQSHQVSGFNSGKFKYLVKRLNNQVGKINKAIE